MPRPRSRWAAPRRCCPEQAGTPKHGQPRPEPRCCHGDESDTDDDKLVPRPLRRSSRDHIVTSGAGLGPLFRGRCRKRLAQSPTRDVLKRDGTPFKHAERHPRLAQPELRRACGRRMHDDDIEPLKVCARICWQGRRGSPISVFEPRGIAVLLAMLVVVSGHAQGLLFHAVFNAQGVPAGDLISMAPTQGWLTPGSARGLIRRRRRRQQPGSFRGAGTCSAALRPIDRQPRCPPIDWPRPGHVPALLDGRLQRRRWRSHSAVRPVAIKIHVPGSGTAVMAA